MANSSAHRFGQIIGNLLEEIMAPQLEKFCEERGLYLDKRGFRGRARPGQKVSWIDIYGNSHDLDFVIEKGGTKDVIGRPLAFIEAAWRRYTKHSRNKAQEIQGAILPIAEKYEWDQPFKGVILAGIFTPGSLSQMKSSGFEIVLFPYEKIVVAFETIGINARFDEATPDDEFQSTINAINLLSVSERENLKDYLVRDNQVLIDNFFEQLQKTLDRAIDQIILIPLHGNEYNFTDVRDAVSFITSYQESSLEEGFFRKYEIIIRYSNGDKIDASFSEKDKAIGFLLYIEEGALS